MASSPAPQYPERGLLEAFLAETAVEGGNPYAGTEAIEAAEGPDWWKHDDPDDDPDDELDEDGD